MAQLSVGLRHHLMDLNPRDSMLKQFLLMVGGDRQFNFLKWYECGYVVDVALNFSDGIQKILQFGFLDVIVLDLTWNRTGLAQFCDEVRRRSPQTKLVALVNGDNDVRSCDVDLAINYRACEDELIDQITRLQLG